jgi:hypothetical protein
MSGAGRCPCGFDEPHGTTHRAWRHKQQHLRTFPDVDARTVQALDHVIAWEDRQHEFR